MLTEKVKSGIHHSSSLPSSPTSPSPSSSSVSLLLPPPSAPSLDSFLIKSQANGISKSRSNSSSSSSSTTSSRAHRTDTNTKSHTTPDPHHNDGAGHTGSKGDSSRHQTENTLAQLAVTCLRFNVEVLARARASGCVHAVSILSIHPSLLPSCLFIICFNTSHTYVRLIIHHTYIPQSNHLSHSVSLSLHTLTPSLYSFLSLPHTFTHSHSLTHYHSTSPLLHPSHLLTHSLTNLSYFSPPLIHSSSSPSLLLINFIQFFEHLEEMVIYDTGRVCARALIQELVIDMPVQPLPAPTPLGSPDGEGLVCYDVLCYVLLI